MLTPCVFFRPAFGLHPDRRHRAQDRVGSHPGAKTDVEKVQKFYDWSVANAYREPKVRGCGEGDIQTMLETVNLGGKC